MNHLAALQRALLNINQLVSEAVAEAQAAGQNPADMMRGLIVSLDEVEQYLNEMPLSRSWDTSAAEVFRVPLDVEFEPPFANLIHTFDLTPLDAYILLVCLAPDLDRRYERLYAYLQDDVSQRRPTLNLVMNLLGGTPEGRFAVWERLRPGHPLREHRLMLTTAPPERPDAGLLSHVVRVEARIVSHLLGVTAPDERIRLAILPIEETIITLPDSVYVALYDSFPLNPIIYMQGRRDFGQVETAAALCAAYGLSLLPVDVHRLKNLDLPLVEACHMALREAALDDAALLIEGWHELLDDHHQPPPDIWRKLYLYKRPVFLCGEDEWAAQSIQRTRRLLRVSFDVPGYEDRLRAWQEFGSSAGVDFASPVFDEVSSKFRLTRSQIARAVHTAVDMAASRRGEVERADVYAGIQAHVNLNLGHLAQRITPRVNWDDLVLPPEQINQLREITLRARYAPIVQESWGFSETIRGSYGVSALFAGESGTGKTLSAQVIAHELGLPLYRIDLSAVVSKYIGETEKNLKIIFTEARSSNAILFFDEADAIFGKRSEVKDAHDRYANIEIAYLLQQVEDYEGVAILATNMRQNLDEAFTRRLDFLIDFPFPDVEYRERLWIVHFPAKAPLDVSVNLTELAERYPLAGGNIRNAALAAAYLAAADGGVITMQHLYTAVRREHQKMGRLLEDDYSR